MSHVVQDQGKPKVLATGKQFVFRGLKFEHDVEIGQKGTFLKGLERRYKNAPPHR